MLVLIILLQGISSFLNAHWSDAEQTLLVADKEMEEKIRALRKAKLQDKTQFFYPFNPNFISDYKGFLLGMELAEIDRLHQFRKQGKFVNTPREFQNVTGVSDSLLSVIAPQFKFPVRKTKPAIAKTQRSEKNSGDLRDLNTVSASDLEEVYGIGPVLSRRIIRFRSLLGGFRSSDVLHDVYGLNPEVIKRVSDKFTILTKPTEPLLNINEAGENQLKAFGYFTLEMSRAILEYRTQIGAFTTLDELKDVPGFPKEKFERISLYLTL